MKRGKKVQIKPRNTALAYLRSTGSLKQKVVPNKKKTIPRKSKYKSHD